MNKPTVLAVDGTETEKDKKIADLERRLEEREREVERLKQHIRDVFEG